MQNTARRFLPLLTSITGGAVCTVVFAIVAAFYSAPATQWGSFNEHNPTSVEQTYLSLISEKSLTIKATGLERIEAFFARDLGYTSLDIRYYDTSRKTELRSDESLPMRHRSFLTELGWPNSAFITNSRSVGLRIFANAKLGKNNPTDDAELYDGKQTTLRILWPGFCLNSLLAAALILLAVLLFRRFANYFYFSRTITAAVCIGLWLALLSAWGVEIAHHAVTFMPVPRWGHDIYDEPLAFDSTVRSINIPSSAEWDRFFCTVSTSIGYCAEIVIFSKEVVPNRSASVVSDQSLFRLG